MTIGTPGFRGARLVEAREARGLSGIALADLIPLTRAAISIYERDGATPSPETFVKICDVLKLPPLFFTRPLRSKSISAVYYRSRSSATKAARVRAERRFAWLTDLITPYLTDFVNWPAINIPPLGLPSNPLNLFAYEIDDLALEVREYWQLGDRPIGNMVWLLENNGVLVSRGDLEAKTLDSFSAWVDERPCVYINSDQSSGVREQYDCAHELGHLLLHANVSETDYHVHHREYEDQSHRFAGAVLLPHTSFMRDIYTPTLNAFRLCKPKWLASIGAMLHRCQDLGLVESEQATNLWRAYSRQGWRKHEPLDEILEFEQPRLLADSVRLLLRGEHQSAADILASVPISATDIEDLTGLAREELSGGPAPVKTVRRDDSTPPRERPGDILPFRHQEY